jgi:hypothetical protein
VADAARPSERRRAEPPAQIRPEAEQSATKPSSVTLAAAIATLEGRPSAIRAEPGVLPAASAPPGPFEETPEEGLVLAPMSMFSRDSHAEVASTIPRAGCGFPR